MLLKPDAPKPRKIAVRVWPKAIPQFNVGHLDVVQVWGFGGWVFYVGCWRVGVGGSLGRPDGAAVLRVLQSGRSAALPLPPRVQS